MNDADLQRFWSKVTKGPGCWIWQGAPGDKGYGRFKLNERNRYAHDIAYEIESGPVPDGLELDHTCRVRLCVRRSHLKPVTHAENCQRAAEWHPGRRVTHCPLGHPYDEENTLRQHGHRRCRTCRRASWHRWDEARKAAA